MATSVNGFGILCTDTLNIGDDIQTIAAMDAIVEANYLIMRDDMDIVYDAKTYERLSKDKLENIKIATICSGWFMHAPGFSKKVVDHGIHDCQTPIKFPPPNHIIPLFISFHISPAYRAALCSDKCIAYYKKYEPIGCRDVYTRDLLLGKGVDAYFSGCLTLTLKNEYSHRTDTVCHALDKHSGLSNIICTTHVNKEYTKLQLRDRLDLARSMLQKYMTAKSVVTDRLHCYLPCKAFKTDVKYVGVTDQRIKSLVNLTDDEYASLREKLLVKVNEFVNKFQVINGIC